MFDIGSGELLLILIAVLVFFGPRKLPELAQSLGRGLREFKKAQREFTDHINDAMNDETQRSRGTVARRSSLPPVSSSRSDINELPDGGLNDEVLFPSSAPHPLQSEPLNQMAIEYPAEDLPEGSVSPDLADTSPTPSLDASATPEVPDTPELPDTPEAVPESIATIQQSEAPPAGATAVAEKPKPRRTGGGTTRRSRDNREI